MRETNDHGAFNSWGRDRYWNPGYGEMAEELRRNPDFPLLDAAETVVIRDNVFECANGWDIDLDDGSSNYLIRGNLCLKGGIKNREGICRRVVNNVMLGNTFHPHVWFEGSRDVFERNVIFTVYKDIGLRGWGESFDYNLIYDSGARGEEARELQAKSGMDGHSLCGDFRYVFGKERGFWILDEELLRRLGIAQLDVKDCGVTDSRLKEKALSVFDICHGVEGQEEARETVYDRDGMLLKPLKGLGEVSATGMYEEKGILVTKISGESKWRKRGFRERDVILTVNVQEADSPKEAGKLLAAQKGEAQVWREQAARTLHWEKE